MNVALIDVDGTDNWPNLALMKLSRWHKDRGDSPDLLFASKVFDFSEDYGYWPRCETLKGGTGYSLVSMLPQEIENTDPDYSIYPTCRFTIQMFTRGCIRRCPWCVVPRKEGQLYSVYPMAPNPRGEHVEVLDNSFFGGQGWRTSVEWLLDHGQPVSLHGVDVRTVHKDQAEALQLLTHHKQIHIAWDDAEVDMRPHFDRVCSLIAPSNVMCYVLIGYGTSHDQDEYRVREIHKRGMTPYVMGMNRKDAYQQRFQKWVNGHAFKSVKWADFHRIAVISTQKNA